MCDHCRRAKYTRHKASVSVLANRDGTDCGICGEPVDMTIRMPDLMSASVDHIYPYARGGSHDPSNLQLAHNICNRRKSARLLTPEAIASI
jgi:5-methylcytosine-specific restriction endonuclease McrA